METSSGNELTLRGLYYIYRRRRKIVYGATAGLFLLCILYCITATRLYESVGTIQIQKESSDGLGLDSLMSAAGDASDALELNINIQTQVGILESDTLALQTVKKLNLEQSADFQSGLKLPHWVDRLLDSDDERSSANAPLEQSPRRRAHVLKVFSRRLTVKPISGTRLIEIDYLSSDPKLSAAVVNELTQRLIEYTFKTRFDATNQASTWLGNQLGELRAQSENLQAKVVALQRDSGVYSLGTVDAQGREQAYSGVLDQLGQQTVALAVVRQNRILKEAILQAALNGNAELLSGLAGNATATTANSLALIQSLREQESAERSEIGQAEIKYGPQYPRLPELRAKLEGIERSISEESNRLRERARSDFEIASRSEKATSAEYDKSKQAAEKLNDKAIEFAIVRQEADESRTLYEDLLKRLREAGVLAGLKSSNITIVDPGLPPAKPKKPNVPVYLLASIVAGAAIGLVLMLLVDAFDNKIGGVPSLEEATGRDVLGVLPHVEVKVGSGGSGATLICRDDGKSTYAESVRAIRTSLFLTANADRHKIILVTSSLAGEGKTTFSANLAVVLAQLNRKVLLVDMDLRRGMIRKRLHLPVSAGLSEMLAGQTVSSPRHSIPGVENLEVILAGAVPPNPAELLAAKSQELISSWKNEYDFIILDCAPVLPVTDALIVNQFADISVLIARDQYTEKPQIQRSLRMISENAQHFVGLVLNDLGTQDESYYGYYGYRKYSYNYEEERK